MSIKFKKRLSRFHLPLNVKLSVSTGLIVVVLLMSGLVAIREFERMSHNVSDLISDNITSINKSTALAVTLDEFNLKILSVVGNADSITVSGLDPAPYLDVTDGIIKEFIDKRLPYSDSLKIKYDAYISVAGQLDEVIVSDFINSRQWFVTRLQPAFDDLKNAQKTFNAGIHDDLHSNSVSFDESFYRSIMPVVVSMAVGIALCLLLLYFVTVYLVKPIGRMVKGLDDYKRFNTQYKCTFEGDDALQDLNGSVADIIDENITLKKRIRKGES